MARKRPRRPYASIPTATVNLDAPPLERWGEAAAARHKEIERLLPMLKAVLLAGVGGRRWLLALICGIFRLLLALRVISYADDILALAELLHVAPGELALLQFVYEASAACTSIVVEQKDSGKPLHVRTMDWLMPFDLRPLTLQLEFTQGGRLLYTATTWLGFVGIYSASRPGAFSISINYRQTGGNVLHNLAAALTGGAALGSCIRSVCTREDSFEQAVMHCSRAPLAAPCYIIIAGCQAGQGVVLTRERRRSVRPRLLSEGPLVQVNSDSWDVDPLDDVLESKARRRTAQRLLSKLAKQPSCAWDVAARDPIYNWITVYAFVACAADGLYESKVRCGPSAGDILRQQEEWEEEQGIAAEEEEEEDASAASGIASFFSGLLNFGPESSWGDDMAAVAAAVRERELAEEAYDEAADSDFVPDDEDDMEEDEWADYADEPLDAMD